MELVARGIEASMIIILLSVILVFAAVLVWILFFPQLRNLSSNFDSGLQPVHLPAVLSLIDSKHEEVLRNRVSSREMRAIERARTRALIEYFGRIATNSAVILRASQDAARSASDPAIRQHSSELARLALSTRIAALRALSALYIALIWPGFASGLRSVEGSYEKLLLSHNRGLSFTSNSI
jgi:hypothetical protein